MKCAKMLGIPVILICFSPVATSQEHPQGRVEVAKIRPAVEGRVNQVYWGTVTGITKDSITVQHEKDQPKKFAASETLAAGKVPMEPRHVVGRSHDYLVPASSMYRLTDVKVGDRVTIRYAHLDGVSICDHICIHKRPGGRMPPLPEEAEALRGGRPRPGSPKRLYIPYHEYMDAYWDLEDKGIPYPEKFGYMRRFPKAPMPHEVK